MDAGELRTVEDAAFGIAAGIVEKKIQPVSRRIAIRLVGPTFLFELAKPLGEAGNLPVSNY
jgi:hypothetical protein